ncbi:MAG: NADH-quinone oxidoreductase subunit N [Chloroflexota bacterium]|nr:NADH-quinone oxidoreductase subunit N [Chloroflexota bacterium]
MSLTVPDINLSIIAPALIVAITAIVVLLGELVTPAERKRWLGYLSIVGLIIAAFAAVNLWGTNASGFSGMVVADNFGLFLTLTITLGAALSILLSIPFIHAHKIDQGEYYVLLLGSVSGMILMATATDLIVIFLGLELLSLPLYILAAFERENTRSLEAGVKYFLLGAFSSAFFLYGIALVFGATGSTNLRLISQSLNLSNSVALIGVGLLIVGFGFKVALVPFHWWTPDVYDGAPTTITAFMSVAVKAAAFGAFFRTFQFALPALAFDWRAVLALIAVLTMTLGNVAALLQSNVKRMLAYSSIAHAGYILIALVAMSQNGLSSALFYILAYTLTNLGAFGAVIALGNGEKERLEIRDYAGAAREHPLVALVLTICLLSLAGFPPFAGFVGKFLIFSAAVENGLAWLAIIGVLNSLVSVYFYLRPVVQMYMSEPAEGWSGIRVAPLVALALLIAVAGVIALGVFPAPAIALAQSGLIR